MSYHCSVLVVLRHFVKWRSLVVGITASSSSVGMFVVTQITEALLSNYGFKNALRGWAILFFLAIPLAYSYDSKSDVTVGTIKRNDDGSEQGFEATHSPSLSRNGHFIVYLFSVTLVFFAVPTLSIFLVRCELTKFYCYTINSNFKYTSLRQSSRVDPLPAIQWIYGEIEDQFNNFSSFPLYPRVRSNLSKKISLYSLTLH